jgi:hypothetical protein
MSDLTKAPAQPLLTRMSAVEVADLIEEQIEYVDADGMPVHLPSHFVSHFMKRNDALPVVSAIATLPLVLGNGRLLSGRGLDRKTGILFDIPSDVLAEIPRREDCTPEAVEEAMQFLMQEWLTDVATGVAGKCTAIAATLSMIERTQLPDRPVYFVTAGKRGGGKTTTLKMIVVAATGIMPAAAAWSPNEEERRKALLSYLMAAVPYVLWDNIPRGARTTCPHIEKACTAQWYSDRKLGASETVTASATCTFLFTGNNITPVGDLASRSLHIRLEADRPDPENRNFRYSDIVGWTRANRAKVLRALYTILLGNPQLDEERNAPARTRFKTWWRLIGSAVENAARTIGVSIDFASLFLAREDDNEDVACLADALNLLTGLGPQFKAADIANLINGNATDPRAVTLREFLFPDEKMGHVVTAKSIGNRLQEHVGEPVRHGNHTLTLRSASGGGDRARIYFVRVDENAEGLVQPDATIGDCDEAVPF